MKHFAPAILADLVGSMSVLTVAQNANASPYDNWRERDYRYHSDRDHWRDRHEREERERRWREERSDRYRHDRDWR